MKKVEMDKVWDVLAESEFDGFDTWGTYDSMSGIGVSWRKNGYIVNAHFGIYQGDEWCCYINVEVFDVRNQLLEDSICVLDGDAKKILNVVSDLIVKVEKMPNIMDMILNSWNSL